MKPHFSEFSYGYALTDEMSKVFSFKSVPTFPSLIEEGRVGGYDVALDISGLPIFLQFKRSDYLSRSNAKYYNLFASHYYRFNIHALKHSKQHNLLLALEKKVKFVYYVAPKFHSQSSLQNHYFNLELIKNSIWLPPKSIGSLPDDNAHSICFNKSASLVYFCSKPRKIEISSINQVSNLDEYFSKKQSSLLAPTFDKLEGYEESEQAEDLNVSIWSKTYDALSSTLLKEEPAFADRVLSNLSKEEKLILKTAKLALIGFGLNMLLFNSKVKKHTPNPSYFGELSTPQEGKD